MSNAKPQDQGPAPVDIGGILKYFFEHSPIDMSKGYDLLSEVSDEELGFFDYVIENSDLGNEVKPENHIVLTGLNLESSNRRVLIKAVRYDDQHHPMIAMAVFDVDGEVQKTQDGAIESFALFANEYGEGFTPVHFQSHRKQ